MSFRMALSFVTTPETPSFLGDTAVGSQSLGGFHLLLLNLL